MTYRNLLVLAAVLAAATACNKKGPSSKNLADAINIYYQAHPSCLWPNLKKFPIQASPDSAKSEGYDALVDAGLLTRTSTEKKVVIISKRENNYDISQQGRGVWNADPLQPGYGNFCYGHRKVTSIDSNSPTSNQLGSTVTVNYHYKIVNVAPWASNQETQTAFPNLRENLSGPRAATATLTKTSNGWDLSSSGPSGPAPAAADGTIVH